MPQSAIPVRTLPLTGRVAAVTRFPSGPSPPFRVIYAFTEHAAPATGASHNNRVTLSMFDDTKTAWEYRVEKLSQVQISNQLNFMGKEGWELVTVFHDADAEYPYECFLKRPRTAQF